MLPAMDKPPEAPSEAQQVNLHLVSDATGETLHAIARATTVQFEPVKILHHRWSLVRTRFQLHRVLEGIEAEPGPVLSTLIDRALRLELDTTCQRLNVKVVNVLDPVIDALQDVIEFNEKNKTRELPFFGQETFLKAQEKGPLTEKTYLDALDKCHRSARADGIDALMDKHHLDAIVSPSGGPAGMTDLIYGDRGAGGSSTPAAVAGYPNITVPAGHISGMPLGMSFFGRAYSEPTLLKLAFAFEQGTLLRKPPRFHGSIG